MSLTQADKDFWIAALTQDLLLEIKKIAASDGDDIRDLALEAAKNNTMEKLGITEKAQEYNDRVEEIKKLKEQLEELNEQNRELGKDIYKTITGNNVYGHYAPTWDVELTKKAQENLEEHLLEFGPAGEEVIRLTNVIKNLERTIRIMTSPAKLRDFLESFAEKFNINLGDDLEE